MKRIGEKTKMRVDAVQKPLYASFRVVWIVVLVILVTHTLAQTDISIVEAIDWNNTGSKIAAGHDSGLVEVIDASTGQLLRTFNLPSVIDVVWSPHNTDLLAVSATKFGLPGTIYILDTATGQEVLILTGGDLINSISWNADGSRIAGAIGYSADPHSLSSVRIWDTTSGEMTSEIMTYYSDVYSLDWSPDGTRIAGGTIDREVNIWDTNTGTIVQTHADHEDIVYAVAWSPDGGRLASASSVDDRTIRVWDAVTGQNLLIIPNSGAREISWSPDGTRIAAVRIVDGVRIWDASTGQLVDSLMIDDLYDVAWSPSGDQIALASGSGMPQIIPVSGATCNIAVGTNDVSGLISAINTANGNGTPDTICLTQSTYTLTAVDNSVEGPNGLPSITSEITIFGNGATITRDPAAPAFRLFHVATGGTLTLDVVTISGGSATSAAPGNDGGAIYNRGTVNLTGSTSITNSTASADGGAVYNRGTFNIAADSGISGNTAADDGGGVYTSSGTLNVTGGTITDNTAGDEGGGIRSVDSTITLTGANITDNTATGGSGGGLYTTSTTLTVTNGVFSGNGGNSGGGLYFTNSPSAASLDGVQILNNTGTNGGGLYLTSSGQAALTNVTVSGNQATSSAAGIWSGGTLTLTDSLVSNNGNTSQPGSAGGIRAAGAALTVSNTVISGNLVNSSSGSGAGVYIASTGTALIDGGEISGNDARNGGGLYNSGSLSLSSIIDDNAAQHYGGGLYITGGTTHIDGSVFINNTAVDRGGAVYNGVTTTSWIHDSCITGNTSADTGGVYSNTAAFDAIDNWWGAASGPSGAGAGTGDAANSNVTFSPFLTTGCPSGTGEGSTQQMMGPQVQTRGAETTPTLAPVRVPFRATFEDEVDWGFGGTWVLDTLNGRNKAPSWTVNTSSRGEESILEMRAPIDLRGTQSPQLTFWERGQIAPNDVVTVEVLPEGASTWSVVDIRSTVPSAWTQRSVSLSAYRGQTIRLRVRVVAGGELEDGTRSVGLWLDDWGVESR